MVAIMTLEEGAFLRGVCFFHLERYLVPLPRLVGVQDNRPAWLGIPLKHARSAAKIQAKSRLSSNGRYFPNGLRHHLIHHQ